jgi:hypothetical protein
MSKVTTDQCQQSRNDDLVWIAGQVIDMPRGIYQVEGGSYRSIGRTLKVNSY